MAKQSTFNPEYAPLWQKALYNAKNVVEGWDKNIQQTKAELKREWKDGNWKDPKLTTEYRPENTFEETA